MTRTPEELKAERAPLRAALFDAGVTHDAIADAEGCDRTLVVHFFAGRRSPAGVEKTARKLLARAQRKAS